MKHDPAWVSHDPLSNPKQQPISEPPDIFVSCNYNYLRSELDYSKWGNSLSHATTNKPRHNSSLFCTLRTIGSLVHWNTTHCAKVSSGMKPESVKFRHLLWVVYVRGGLNVSEHNFSTYMQAVGSVYVGSRNDLNKFRSMSPLNSWWVFHQVVEICNQYSGS